MRILSLQSAVLVSLAVAGLSASACSSSDDTNRPEPGAGAGNTAGSGTAGSGTAGSGTAGSGTAGSGTGGSAPTAGAGNTAGAAGAAAPSLCDGAGTRVFTLDDNAFIEDFECKTGPCNPATMVGYGWSTFNDLGKAGTDAVNMEMADNKEVMKPLLPGYMSATAGTYSGTGANITTKMGFGVGAIFNVVINPTEDVYCADISAFDGVSFWAKSATAGEKLDVNFVLPNTNGASTNAEGKPAGGDCKTNCFNHPKKSITLTDKWEQYTVTFAEAAGGSAKVKNVIQMVGFLSAGATWNYQLDEIAFYKGTAPTAPLVPPEAP